MLARIQRNITWHRAMEISQWIIPFASFFFIWMIIDTKSQNTSFLGHWMHIFQSIHLFQFLTGMIFLTALNLFFETLKWKHSIQKMKLISISESFNQTLKAMAAGFITPFRSGALFARFISNEDADRKKIIDATIQMAVAQFSVTFFVGLTGLSYWLFVTGEFNLLVINLVLISIFLLIGLYFYRNPLKFNFRNTEWKGISINLTLLLYSFLRYFVFILQYVLILKVFGANIELVLAFSLVSITFLVNSLLPSGILGKIGIRELSGILIIGESTGYMIEVSCAAFMIWILNQALPAFLGSLLFLSSNTRTN